MDKTINRDLLAAAIKGVREVINTAAEDEAHTDPEDQVHTLAGNEVHTAAADQVHTASEDQVHTGSEDQVHIATTDQVHTATTDQVHAASEGATTLTTCRIPKNPITNYQLAWYRVPATTYLLPGPY